MNYEQASLSDYDVKILETVVQLQIRTNLKVNIVQ